MSTLFIDQTVDESERRTVRPGSVRPVEDMPIEGIEGLSLEEKVEVVTDGSPLVEAEILVKKGLASHLVGNAGKIPERVSPSIGHAGVRIGKRCVVEDVGSGVDKPAG